MAISIYGQIDGFALGRNPFQNPFFLNAWTSVVRNFPTINQSISACLTMAYVQSSILYRAYIYTVSEKSLEGNEYTWEQLVMEQVVV
ncbi:hypothetical protein M5X11_27180 [Paenibacillus alginolyticus]|uniref:Uncharacterized protein n=1 Tax=Paenibacillus alginolyticus TaxID=59839 RepID=A0ABT4G5X1_9BACL|nr:hypothetical protein [Paenibacillus alginolyticus]MCY9668561.1 hypothetical protein [Paenibacillus alginolyticus]MCY9691576.1 hypothetical protein [Paenibacillus alginolyticus]MEC0146988.1 hypothetical protein [Paenibacillus alginolyticus]